MFDWVSEGTDGKKTACTHSLIRSHCEYGMIGPKVNPLRSCAIVLLLERICYNYSNSNPL